VLLAQPFLGRTARALEARGAQVLAAPYPIGIEGTRLWLGVAARAWGVAEARLAEILERPAARAEQALARYTSALAGKRIAFFPDSQLEIPIARFLQRECGMELLEVGVPYLDRRLMSAEVALLPEGTRLLEGGGCGRAA
jgi:light-independent protochlorophyllide reductase subunit N